MVSVVSDFICEEAADLKMIAIWCPDGSESGALCHVPVFAQFSSHINNQFITSRAPPLLLHFSFSTALPDWCSNMQTRSRFLCLKLQGLPTYLLKMRAGFLIFCHFLLPKSAKWSKHIHTSFPNTPFSYLSVFVSVLSSFSMSLSFLWLTNGFFSKT